MSKTVEARMTASVVTYNRQAYLSASIAVRKAEQTAK